MNLSEKQIKSIAEDLDCGMRVYVDKETKEIKSVMDLDNNIYADEEMWEQALNEIEKNYERYVVFEQMSSNESFKVMADFVETVTDDELRKKLDLGLSLSRPFRNFKDIINTEGEFREKWFSFKLDRYIEYVQEQLQFYNEDE